MGTLIVSDFPRYASSSVISMLYLKSEPRFEVSCDLDVDEKSPKKSLNISENAEEKLPSNPPEEGPLPPEPSNAA